jgi:hypothetical protein
MHSKAVGFSPGGRVCSFVILIELVQHSWLNQRQIHKMAIPQGLKPAVILGDLCTG